MSDESNKTPEPPDIDVRERAGHHTGDPKYLDTRLFMQLLVFNVDPDTSPKSAAEALAAAMRERSQPAVIYADVNNPRGLGLLTWSEDPADFVTKVGEGIATEDLEDLELIPDYTMLGRTYATGYEPDLEFWLLRRPADTVLNAEWPWAVWYPLRRSGDFAQLEGREQASILKEHGTIGRAYGVKDLAHDVRLACHGLDGNDNEFVIGLIGKDLHPLSHVVQRMRSTRQTSEFIEQMGPFFVGHAITRVRPTPHSA